MLEFDGVQSHVLARCIEQFREHVQQRVADVVAAELKGFRPRALAELWQELDVIGRQLTVKPNVMSRDPSEPWPSTGVHEIHARLLKRIVVAQRRALAREIDGPRQKTTDRDAIAWLERELRVLDQILRLDWMLDVRVAEIPRITDFLTIRHAESLLGSNTPVVGGATDDKFRILAAAWTFPEDLARIRERCELRDLSVALCYLDIDDFKQFNSQYGETRIDRDLLSPFMELLEAHAFGRGTAYRMGGDEYVILLANASDAEATAFAAGFSRKLADLRTPGITVRPTVSTGVVVLTPDCPLTEREALARADRAKAFAKQAGKRCIAGYDHPLMREEDLRIRDVVAPPRSTAQPASSGDVGRHAVEASSPSSNPK